MPASTLPVLPESERLRLLGLLGFSSWRRRGSIAAAVRGSVQRVPTATPDAPPAGRAPPPRRPPPAVHPEPVPVRATPTALRAAELCLLVLAERRHADAPLVKALALLLPGAMICTADTATAVKARFALSVGGPPLNLPGLLAIAAPPLAELAASAVAKRRLWWALKPLLRELRR